MPLDPVLSLLVKIITVAAGLWAVVRYLFEPHVARIIARVIDEREAATAKERHAEAERQRRLEARLHDLEASMSNHDTERKLMLQSLAAIAQTIHDTASRQTQAIERIAEKSDQTAIEVTRQGAVIDMIRDSMERRSGGR